MSTPADLSRERSSRRAGNCWEGACAGKVAVGSFALTRTHPGGRVDVDVDRTDRICIYCTTRARGTCSVAPVDLPGSVSIVHGMDHTPCLVNVGTYTYGMRTTYVVVCIPWCQWPVGM